MRWRHSQFLVAFFFLLAVCPLRAAPPAPATAPATAPAAVPDYGGRDSAPLGAGADAPNPAAQAGRAVEALALVLVGVGGVVYALKRFGLVQPGANGKPARISLGGFGGAPRPGAGVGPLVTVEASQTLPGGATLHLVTVRGRTLLLGATPQSVQTLTEWREGLEGDQEAQAFEDYLAAAGDAADTASPLSAANTRLRSLLARRQDEQP